MEKDIFPQKHNIRSMKQTEMIKDHPDDQQVPLGHRLMHHQAAG